MTEAILIAIEAVSFVVIVIIMAVMANTMAMTARERGAEYATLKALGFSNAFVALLILGESLGIALVGGLAGVLLTFPIAAAFADAMGSLFPIFYVSEQTVLMQLGAALIVGLVAAALPAWRTARLSIIDGLRAVA
jgi:putative ABC transport system permease protein